MSAEQRLQTALFDGYMSSVRPVTNASDALLITLSISLMQLTGVDESLQVMTTSGWMNVEWTDPRLVWEPADHDGLTQIAIPPPNKLWLPKFTIMNTVAGSIYSSEYYDWFGVRIEHTGKILWQPGGYFTTQCDLDIAYYPFDSQMCNMTIANWIYNGGRVNLTYSDTAYDMLLDHYTRNGAWDVISIRITRQDKFYNTSIVPFPQVDFTIKLHRKYLFYITSLLIPCILLSVLAIFVFCLPPEFGEKISLCTSLLLSFVVYIMVLSDNLPKTSLSVPLIQIYLLMAMTSTALTVIISTWILHAYHQTSPVPPPSILLKLCRISSPIEPIRDVQETNGVLPTSKENVNSWNLEGNRYQNNETPVDSIVNQEANNRTATLLYHILQTMKLHRQDKMAVEAQERIKNIWVQVAMTLDRYSFFFFIIMLSLGSLTVLVLVPKSPHDRDW